MLDEDYEDVADDEGDVVHHTLKEDVFEGVDDDGDILREGLAGKGAVEFPKGVGIAEKLGKYAVFKFAVGSHESGPCFYNVRELRIEFKALFDRGRS
jgi:hypothetical protein